MALNLQSNDNDDEIASRRVHPRRGQDRCVGILNGQMFPVENWSLGGVLLNGDVREFGVDAQVNVTLKFKLAGRIMDITHPARVRRKGYNKIAFQFEPLNKKIRDAFLQVIDDANAVDFANSQLI